MAPEYWCHQSLTRAIRASSITASACSPPMPYSVEQPLHVAGQDAHPVAFDPVDLGDRPAHLLGDLLAGQPGCFAELLELDDQPPAADGAHVRGHDRLPSIPKKNVLVHSYYCIDARAGGYSHHSGPPPRPRRSRPGTTRQPADQPGGPAMTTPQPPPHPLPALTTSELASYRRQPGQAITGIAPDAPAQAGLHRSSGRSWPGSTPVPPSPPLPAARTPDRRPRP